MSCSGLNRPWQMLTDQQWKELAEKTRKLASQNQRPGQAIANAVLEITGIHSTEAGEDDPFYNDAKIGDFLIWLLGHEYQEGDQDSD